MRHLEIAFLALCAGLATAVPLRFEADVTKAATFQATAYRGETLEIEASLTDRGRAVTNDAPAALYWQTNGMQSAWWTAPAVMTGGVIRATWSPTNDVGVSSYRVFLGVADGGLNYRANMTLRMIGSPGSAPNALPLPVSILDFAAVSVANAPWALPYTAGDNIVITNGVISSTASGGIAEETDPVWTEERSGIVGIITDAQATAMQALDLANALGTSKADAADLGSAAYRDADEFATAADEQLLYQFVMGSNVVFEVTNYNSRVRAPSMRLLQLDPDTREYYTVWAETNGLTRTLAAANGYTDAASNALDRAKAARAWSRHTSGLGADAPDGVTWVSTPQTVIAGGYEYTRTATAHGEVWVLASNGLALGGDTNAFFTVSSGDGELLLSIEKTDAVLVGVDATGITVSGSVVSIPLDVVSEAQPECYATTNLVGATWAKLNDGLPGWVTSAQCTGASGAWVWQIETDAPRAFLQFRVLQPGGTVIRHHAQTDLSHGILIGNRRFLPVVTGDALTWEAAD